MREIERRRTTPSHPRNRCGCRLSLGILGWKWRFRRRTKRLETRAKAYVERDLRMKPNGGLRSFGAQAPNRRSAGGRPLVVARRVRQRGGWQRCRPPFRMRAFCRLPIREIAPFHRVERALKAPHRMRLDPLGNDLRTGRIIPDIPVIHRPKTPFSALRDSVSMTASGCGRERSAGNQRHLDQPQATVKAQDFLRKMAEWKQKAGAGSGVDELKRKWRRRDTPRRSR